MTDFLREPVIRQDGEKMHVTDISELGKQSAARKKLMDLERARNESRATTNSTVLW